MERTELRLAILNITHNSGKDAEYNLAHAQKIEEWILESEPAPNADKSSARTIKRKASNNPDPLA